MCGKAGCKCTRGKLHESLHLVVTESVSILRGGRYDGSARRRASITGKGRRLHEWPDRPAEALSMHRKVARIMGAWPGWCTFAALVVAVLGMFLPAAAAQTPPGTPADLVIINAKIWTGVQPSGAEPTGIAIVGDTIVGVGADAEVRARVGANTRVIDAAGRRVIPGITDSHTHIISGGLSLSRLYLREVRGKEEFIAAVQSAVARAHKGEWVVGGRWSVESWDKPETPNRSWLDPVTGEVPVFLNRMDGHEALVNSATLKLAGIDAAGPADPLGGEIERDPQTHEPTGILKESAMGLASRLIPEPSDAQRYEALLRAMKHANSLGVTSVHDMSAPADVEVFRRAAAENAMTLRITAYLSVDEWSGQLDEVVKTAHDAHSPMFALVGFKGYMDGSMGSRTAYMREPYSDATPTTPYPRGQLSAFASSQSFRQQVVQADAKGLQMAVHAIGDEANHLLLDAYEAAAKENLVLSLEGGASDPSTLRTSRRPRAEHAQHLLVSDIPRFASLRVVASMQPFHKADDGRYAEKAVGAERLKGSYAYRQLVDVGALLVFGSDWPVVTLNPFAGIDAAVNAKTLSGEVWLPSHSLTVVEALRAYTVSPPKAVHQESRLGTLGVGKLADLVILLDDPLTIPPSRLADVKVVHTIVGGKVVFTAAP